MNNAKAIIFDFGGVVTRTLFETHELNVVDQERNILGAKNAVLNTVHFDVRKPRESFVAVHKAAGINRSRELT